MSTKTFSDPELELLHEAWHLPHMERALQPLVIVNQNEKSLWFPRRMDLALATGEDPNSAAEGGTWRDPAPTRPINQALTNGEAWVFWLTAACFGIPAGLWAYWTWFA